MEIPVDEYLAYAQALTPEEEELRRRAADWLPERIFDAHVHTNLPEHVGTIDAPLLGHMMTTFPSFTLEQSAGLRALLYPGRQVAALRFPMPYRGIRHRQANAYLLGQAPPQDRVALYGIPTEIDYTVGLLGHPRVAALKMYYQYFSPPAQRILEVFPAPVLEEAQARGVPIILHLPRMITRCVDELLEVLDRFPRLVVVLAHLGLPHMPVPGLREAYAAVAKRERVYMDTAMIPSAEVVGMALEAFGTERIVFGSDEPLNLIRAVVYAHPVKGERLATPYPYHWADPAEQRESAAIAAGATHAHWQQLAAIGSALAAHVPEAKTRAAESIFHDTAFSLFRRT